MHLAIDEIKIHHNYHIQIKSHYIFKWSYLNFNSNFGVAFVNFFKYHIIRKNKSLTTIKMQPKTKPICWQRFSFHPLDEYQIAMIPTYLKLGNLEKSKGLQMTLFLFLHFLVLILRSMTGVSVFRSNLWNQIAWKIG